MYSRPIRVLHYIRHLDLGGTAKTCQLFFNHASEDFDVLLVHEKTGDQTRLPLCEGRVAEVDSYPNGFDNPNPAELQAVINDFDPDIMHTYRSGLGEYPEPGLDIGVRNFVVTNVFGHLNPNVNIRRDLFMSKWLMDAALRRVAPISRSFIGSRFDFVNNPIEAPSPIIHPFKADKNAIIVGRCGRPDNGIYNAINVNAVAKLREQGYNIHFAVVAPPPNMVADLERLNIPHYIVEPTTDPMELSAFYNAIDVYAHARADGETFGVNIAEAMVHGKPVVTHIATPSFPGMGVFQAQTELVDHGRTGFVVENDLDTYTAALERLISNESLRINMGKAGYIKAMDEYHIDVCIDKLERIYRDIMNG